MRLTGELVLSRVSWIPNMDVKFITGTGRSCRSRAVTLSTVSVEGVKTAASGRILSI